MKIVIVNQKGGVGKSTITINLGYSLSQYQKKTLIIDLDPQAHSSGIYAPILPKAETISAIFDNRKVNVDNLVCPATLTYVEEDNERKETVDNLFVIPSTIHLATSSENVISRIHREKILNTHLKKIEKKFNYILIDCPPTLGVLTTNAVFTADLIVIPTIYSKNSLDGIADLFNCIAQVKESENYNYKILRNMRDSRSTRTNNMIEQILKEFKDHLYHTIIRKNEAINQAQLIDQPIFVFDPKSPGVEDFNSLTKEILNYG